MDIATNFASGEEALGAIFQDDKDKGKRKEDVAEGSAPQDFNRKKKKKKKQRGKQDASDPALVAATEWRNPRGPPGDQGSSTRC